MPTLQLQFPAATEIYELSRPGRITLGSAADNAIQIKDASISRYHAEIIREEQRYRLRDLGSTNKSCINGIAIIDALLNDTVSLRFGNIEGTFRPSECDTPGAPALSTPIPTGRLVIAGSAPVYHRFQATLVTLGWKSSNLIQIKDPSVSGAHAQIALVEGRYRIKDLNSSNKTFVNGKIITECDLNNGDKVHFGAVEATFVLEAPTPAPVEKGVSSKTVHIPHPITEGTSASPDQAQIEKERDALTATLTKEFEAKLAALAAEKDQEKAASESQLRKEIETLQEEQKRNAASAEKEAAIQKEIEQLTAQLAEARKTIVEKEAKITEAEGKIDTLLKQRESADSEAAALAARLDDELHQTEAFAATNTLLQAQIDELSGRFLEFENIIAALKRERDDAYAALTTAQAVPAPVPEPAPDKPAGAKASLPKPPSLKIAESKSPFPETPPSAQEKQQKKETVRLPADPAEIKALVQSAPEIVIGMRNLLHAFIKNQTETSLLEELLGKLQDLSCAAEKAQLPAVHTMARALEALINDLTEIPGQITPSTLRTVSQSLDFLGVLLDERNISRPHDPAQSHVFAIDDDPEARKIIRASMELLKLRVTCAEDPKTALDTLNGQHFDLVFIDVGLPDMNGFELCTKIRGFTEHRKTPVVFLTGAVTVQNRVQSSLSGGNDFIAKPFNLLELGVKALTWILKGQLGLP